jgi:hypothetical protein
LRDKRDKRDKRDIRDDSINRKCHASLPFNMTTLIINPLLITNY